MNVNKIFFGDKENFESKLAQISSSSSYMDRMLIAKNAIGFALSHSTGYYSSEIIEKVYLDVAQVLDYFPVQCNYEKSSILHVMTESYFAGGHTRVVERWIERNKENKHSLLFTKNESQQVPERLQKAVVDTGGTLTLLPDKMPEIIKGYKLREIASKYEYIVLHIHMDDVIPLIAFGTKSFTRPVIFFNHADDLFSVGVSIADAFVDFRTLGQQISLEKRNVNSERSFVLPLQIDRNENEDKKNITNLRYELRLPIDKKIVATAGSPYKYAPAYKWRFKNVAKLLLKSENNILVAIGPDNSMKYWKEVYNIDKKRVISTGLLKPELLRKYFMACDVVVDSFPIGGGLTLVDAVSCGKPVLSLSAPCGQLDYITNSEAYCRNNSEFLVKLESILTSKEVSNHCVENIKSMLTKYNSPEVWEQCLKEIYRSCSEKLHSVYCFKPIPNETPTDVDIAFMSNVKPQPIIKIKFFIRSIMLAFSIFPFFRRMQIFKRDKILNSINNYYVQELYS